MSSAHPQLEAGAQFHCDSSTLCLELYSGQQTRMQELENEEQTRPGESHGPVARRWWDSVLSGKSHAF